MKYIVSIGKSAARTSFVLCMILVVASCGSSRKAVKEGEGEGAVSGITTGKADKLTRTTVAKIASNRPNTIGITAKAKVNLGSLSASGTLKMRRDEIIQCSLSALLGLMEVGRLELTPEYFFYQDRINHEYVKAQWAGVPQLRDAGINFYTFQALFWEELFVPGQQEEPTASDFETTKNGNQLEVQPKTSGNAQYAIAVKFLVEAASGLIQQTSVKPSVASALHLNWTYTDWTKVDGKSFPSDMTMSASSQANKNEIRFRLSNVQTDSKLKVEPSPLPGSNYSHINITRLFRRLQ